MIGTEIHSFARQLWPINRSLTGAGVRETLGHIKKRLPDLSVVSVQSGTKVFDWVVPKEWHVKDAYITTPSGARICDFSKNNLHLVGYSIPYRGKISLEELQGHLHSLPTQPNAIPYVTSYYKSRWGFCITQEQRDLLEEGDYEIVIDSRLFFGELNYGELVIPGKTEEEIFLSTYVCHPSMANNELSGPTVLTYLGEWLSGLPDLKYTYRIVFAPETIGSITYLSKNYQHLKANVVAGFNVSCVGDDRSYSYLPSRNGGTISDRVAQHVLKWIDPNYKKYSWLDRGSDERQYCAPGIDLPIASIMRSKYGEYPEYHTSLDNLEEVVTPSGLNGGYQAIQKALELLERNIRYTVNVLCEPQMGKRGLYPTLSTKSIDEDVTIMMNFLSLCDGRNSMLDIAEKLGVPSWNLYSLANKLLSQKLISEG